MPNTPLRIQRPMLAASTPQNERRSRKVRPTPYKRSLKPAPGLLDRQWRRPNSASPLRQSANDVREGGVVAGLFRSRRLGTEARSTCHDHPRECLERPEGQRPECRAR
jgi:hypothetical protein